MASPRVFSSQSEIGAPDVIAARQRGAGVGERDGAVFDDIAAMANAQRVEDILLDELALDAAVGVDAEESGLLRRRREARA